MDEIIKEKLFINKRRMLPEIKLDSLANHSTKQRFWLALKATSLLKRIFWLIVIIISFLVGAYILAELLVQFFRAPIQKTVAHPALLQSIPYPGISLCHPQTVIHYKAKQLVDKIKIPEGFSKEDALGMLPSGLGVFTENQWGPVDANNLSMVNEILQLNDISVLEAVKAVGINCSEFILRCSFNKKSFPCFQDDHYFTFRETMTHVGVCCSFNYDPNNGSYEPLIVNTYGARGGLSIIATSHPHSNDGTAGLLLSDGFILFIHSPLDFPTDGGSNMALLEVGKITSIAVHPLISEVSAEVMALPLQSRKCLTGDDGGLRTYSRVVCTTKCLTRFIHDKCECRPFFLPAPVINDGSIRNCNVLDGDCFQRIYFDVKKTRCGACLPACREILYKMSTSTVSYSFANFSINPIYDQTNLTKSEFTVHIFFAGSTVPVRKSMISQSFITLLSNFGGVFNLVLGISVFSILELFYYFFIQLPQLMQNQKKVKPVITFIQAESKIFQ